VVFASARPPGKLTDALWGNSPERVPAAAQNRNGGGVVSTTRHFALNCSKAALYSEGLFAEDNSMSIQ